ncbi:ATP-binding protein [Streptomyces sp. NPDC060028]|uniref:ATP-binding protein n=1 Tax=Streptomyces sp. NPDC060028 TaxID=3347041 RepID=UPI0036CBBE43
MNTGRQPEQDRQPEQSRRLMLAGVDGDVVTRSRDFTRTALADWGWLAAGGAPDGRVDGEAAMVAEDVLLLVSEVVANACLHAGGPGSLLLLSTGSGLRIEVTDGSPSLPELRRRADPTRPGGHGLLIVDRLTRNWGADPVLGGGKCVWLDVDAPAEVSRPEAGRPASRP